MIGLMSNDEIRNSKVQQSDVYSISKRFAIPSSGVVDLIFDPTPCGCENFVLFPFTFKAYGAGPINIDVYLNPSYDADGTLIPPLNRDLTSLKTSDVIVRLNPTVTAAGIILPNELVIMSNGTAAVSVSGGEASENLITKIDVTKKFLFRLTNTEATAASGHASFSWWER